METSRALLMTGFALLVLAPSTGTLAHAQSGAVAEIQIAPPNVSLTVGQRTSVFATAYDAKNNVVVIQRINWTSSSPAVRIETDSTSPDIATLVGVAAGSAIIEVRIGNRTGRATIQVGGGSGTGVAINALPGSGVGNASLIRLEPTSLYLLPGEGARLSPVFMRDDGSPAAPVRLTWKSLLPTVASVDADGGVVAISPGQGLIEAAAGPLAGRTPVVVSLSKIAVTRRLTTMSPGVTDTFSVFVPEQNNRPLPPTSLQWRSSDESVARVSPFGVVTAMGGGRAEIVATGFLQELRIPVSVHKQVEFLRTSPGTKDTVRFPIGGTTRFVAEAQDANGALIPEAPISWVLLDTSVAAFDQSTGVMTAKRLGTTRLRIKVVGGGFDTAWTVSVIAGGLKFASKVVGLGTGDRHKVAASLTDESGRPIATATGLRWSSSNPAVARVDGEGNVQAVGFGRGAIVGAAPWGKADTLTVLVQGELLVTSTRGATPDLYALDRSAPSSFNRLTSFLSNEVAASYAPGGTSIVFMTAKDGNQELYTIDADGSNPRRLTTTPAQEDTPEWTPDGKQIVFASSASGSYQIWVMNADGTESRRLTDGPALNFQPAISPDGHTIAFTSTREGNYDIYLMNLDGANQRAFFKNPGKETNPQWMPDGQLGFLQEQRVGTGRNAPTVSVVVRRDASTGQMTNLTPTTLFVTDFAISSQGDLIALIVSVPQQQRGATASRLYLLPTLPGSLPSAVPPSEPAEQVFSPAFRK